MTEYIRDSIDGGLRRITPEKGASAFFTIMSKEEFHENRNLFLYHKEVSHSLSSIRYCKAEWFRGCIMGTLRIPQKSEQRSPQFSFGFYMTERALIVIENAGALEPWIERRLDVFHDIQTPEQLLLQIMEQMIEDDILYLSHLEKKLEEMEDTLVQSLPNEFFLSLTKYRRKLSELNDYYGQLTAVGEQMQSNPLFAATQREDLWDKYTRRTEHLQNHVNLLKETVLQLRELFQSLQDAKQNKVMGILTIVTTLFLPLTLLTGWYGMNFVHMPELGWKYGYPAVAAVAMIVVVLEVIWFKRKKFF